MSRKTQDAPFGVSVDSVDHKEHERELDVLQKGAAASMHDDPSLLAGERPMGSAALNAIGLSPDYKEQEKDEFHQALILLNDYLNRLDQILNELRQELADLYEQRQAAIKRMEKLFEEAHDIEDLIAGIKKDGMSPEEAQAAAKLLGRKADGQSPEEIVILLGALHREKEAEGREASDNVDGLDAKIAEKERQVATINDIKQKGLEAQSDHNYANVISFNNNAEDYFATWDAASPVSDVEERAEINAEMEVVADQSLIAEPEFGGF